MNNVKERRFTTREELKNGVDKWVEDIRSDKGCFGLSSDGAHRRCVEKAEHFAQRIKRIEMPELDAGWEYTLSGPTAYSDSFASLLMVNWGSRTIDIESYELMHTEQWMTTVPEYAKLHDVSEETVNRWLTGCRFPLAKCGNGKWRIPELSIPAEGDFPDCIVDWYWKGVLTGLPDDYDHLNEYTGAAFSKDEEGSHWMKIYSYDTLKAEAIRISQEDRERLQYILQEDPFAVVQPGHVQIGENGSFYFG